MLNTEKPTLSYTPGYHLVPGWRPIIEELQDILQGTSTEIVVGLGQLRAIGLDNALDRTDARRIEATRLMEKAFETCDLCGERGWFTRLFAAPGVRGELRVGTRCFKHRLMPTC